MNTLTVDNVIREFKREVKPSKVVLSNSDKYVISFYSLIIAIIGIIYGWNGVATYLVTDSFNLSNAVYIAVYFTILLLALKAVGQNYTVFIDGVKGSFSNLNCTLENIGEAREIEESENTEVEAITNHTLHIITAEVTNKTDGNIVEFNLKTYGNGLNTISIFSSSRKRDTFTLSLDKDTLSKISVGDEVYIVFLDSKSSKFKLYNKSEYEFNIMDRALVREVYKF